MLDIRFHINLFIALIEQQTPLNTSNKRTDIDLPIYSLIEVEHPLKISHKQTHITYLFH